MELMSNETPTATHFAVVCDGLDILFSSERRERLKKNQSL